MAGLQNKTRAKINLSLNVLATRSDGFHELDMLVAFAELGDDLSVQPLRHGEGTARIQLDVAGPFAAGVPADASNLVMRSAEALADVATDPHSLTISITKTIPAGAGLGGGAGDAAATLKALNRLWACGLSIADLADRGRQFGADVPMCLYSRALQATGIGEVITRLDPFPPQPAVLVWPGVFLSTAKVFAAFDVAQSGGAVGSEVEATSGPLPATGFRDDQDLLEHLRARSNDLEPSAIVLQPVVQTALEALRAEPGCRIARMSGSGSACFALFPSLTEAEATARRLGEQRPDWWVQATTLS